MILARTSSKKSNKKRYTEDDVRIKKGVASYYRMSGSMVVLIFLLICFGLIMLFSASVGSGYAFHEGNASYYFVRQSRIILAAFGVALLFAQFVDIGHLEKKSLMVLVYAGTTALLAMVAVMGLSGKGAQRWLQIAGVRFQPSEVAKIAAVFCLACYFSSIKTLREKGGLRCKSPRRQFFVNGFFDIVIPAVAMGVWLILIVLQPHVSGFIIMSAIILSVFIAAGIPWKSWLSGLLQLLPILLALIVILSAVFPQWKGVTLQEFVDEKFAHAQNRLDTHNNPDEATSDDIHQVRQAKIALGSGGLTGVGLGNGRQKFNYLPEAHNDYVFAIIGEELGFLGTTCVLALFLAFLIIGLDIAGRAERPFAGMISIGYTILISLQALLNMSVAAQVIPAKGISLPFFSFGGSSNLFL